MTPFEKEIMARTIYGEARGSGKDGMRAVAHCIWNRSKSSKWFAGKNIADTCLFPQQFSCWNASDHNRVLMARVGYDDEQLKDAFRIVEMVGIDDDPTFGATHYYADSMKIAPAWAERGTLTAEIGGHKFYKDVD